MAMGALPFLPGVSTSIDDREPEVVIPTPVYDQIISQRFVPSAHIDVCGGGVVLRGRSIVAPFPFQCNQNSNSPCGPQRGETEPVVFSFPFVLTSLSVKVKLFNIAINESSLVV